ncbi:MAG: hypothetical protein PHC75_07630 [Burkholderiales bacterium]|nr:hypothetical protein [Burkholderiales bacterium]
MKNIKRLLIGGVSIFLASCGAQGNITFDLMPGNCSDGTTNAPYCMGVQIQNNSSGQNYINSTNYPINNLVVSVSGANNIQYPTNSGSSLDPHGCLGSTLGAGATCVFYLKLTGESLPVGTSAPISLVANYNVKNQLFGGGSQSASSTSTFYQIPNMIVTNTNGVAKNYSNDSFSSTYSIESKDSSQLNALTTDSYYGFLYAASQNGLYLSGNQTYAYNKTESVGPFTNVIVSSGTVYPVNSSSLGKVYYASVNPLSSIYWANYSSNVPNNILPGVMTASGGNLYIATPSQVYQCNNSSISSSNCMVDANASPNGSINTLGFSNSIGTSSQGDNLTGLVMGTTGGLFVESGLINAPSANRWMQVTNGDFVSITASIQKIIVDNLGNVYAIDSGFNIYEIPAGGGNKANLLTTLATSGSVAAATYDNAGQILYIANNSGQIYGCFNNSGTYVCDTKNVINSGMTVFGLNIVTSLESYL